MVAATTSEQMMVVVEQVNELRNAEALSMIQEQQRAFVVIYRWHVHSGMDEQFRASWHELTENIRRHRGSLGSRLCEVSPLSYVSIALWPSRELWEATEPKFPGEEKTIALLRAAIARTDPTELLTVVDDLWIPTAIGHDFP